MKQLLRFGTVGILSLVVFCLGLTMGRNDAVASLPPGAHLQNGEWSYATDAGGGVLDGEVPDPFEEGLFPDNVECYVYRGVVLDRGRPQAGVTVRLIGTWTYKGITIPYESIIVTDENGKFNYLIPYDLAADMSIAMAGDVKAYEIKIYSPPKKFAPDGGPYVPSHCIP
jgi:hypothetical protein